MEIKMLKNYNCFINQVKIIEEDIRIFSFRRQERALNEYTMISNMFIALKQSDGLTALQIAYLDDLKNFNNEHFEFLYDALLKVDEANFLYDNL